MPLQEPIQPRAVPTLSEQINHLKSVKKELKKELQAQAKVLKNKKKRLARLKAKMRQMSDEDLQECLHIRVRAR